MITNQRFAQKYGAWLVDTGYDRSLQFVINGANKPEERLGALGDILYAMQELHWDDDLLVLPSDTYYAFKLRDFIQFATEHTGFSTVLAKVPTERIAGRLGCAVVKGEAVVSFVEKPAEPPSDLAAIPFYYYPKAILHELKAYQQEGNSMDAPGSIIPWLLSKDIPVYGYQTDGRTLDVGTTADIKTLSQL